MKSRLEKHYKLIVSLLLCGIITLPNPAWAASSTYNSSATLTFTIQTIENLTHPGDLSGLEALASFEEAGAPTSFVFVTGDGSVTSANPPAGPTPLAMGDTFSYTFSVSGAVNHGTVDASHTGWYGLSFTNTSTDEYQVSVLLDYQLSANASGQSAASSVMLDYFNLDSSFSGNSSVSASSAILPSDTVSGSSGLFQFVLQGSASEELLADVVVTGNLEASGTPVPLPPAAWSFLAAGLMAARLGWRTQRRSHTSDLTTRGPAAWS